MNFPVTDPFLAKYGAIMPDTNKLELNPDFGNIELLTPYCRLSFVYFDPPKQGRQQRDGTTTKTAASALLMFHPGGIEQIEQALQKIVDHNFNAEQRVGPDGQPVVWTPSQLLLAPANMANAIINPLKNGTETWQGSAKPQLYENLRGLYTLNVTLPVTDQQGNPQAPVYLDEQGQPCPAKKFYSGCYARAVIRLSPYPRRGQQGFGKRGVSAYLQVMQFVANGERLGNFDAVAYGQSIVNQAGPVVVDPAFTAPVPMQDQPQTAPAGVPGFPPPPQQQPQYASPAAGLQYAPPAAGLQYAPPAAGPHYAAPPPVYQQTAQAPSAPPAPPPGYVWSGTAWVQQASPQGAPIPPMQPSGYIPR